MFQSITKKLFIWLIVLTLTFTSAACSLPWNQQSSATEAPTSADSLQSTYAQTDLEAFEAFTDQLFKKSLLESTLTMHSLVETPANYGIEDYTALIGDYHLDKLSDTSELVESINTLKTFHYEELSQRQQLTYDILLKSLETDLEYSELYLYGSEVTPYAGATVSLPLILAEYTFSDIRDVDDYIALVHDTDRYFTQMLAYEKLRSEQGLFMDDSIADAVIEQCQTFLAENKTNSFLITTFNSKVDAMPALTDAMPALTDAARTAYKQANEAAVTTVLLPAYQKVIEGVTALKGTNRYKGGLCNYPDGKRYYEYLLKTDLGWSKSVDELDALLNQYLNSALFQISTISSLNSNVISQAESFSFAMTDPNAIIEDLKQRIQADFPAAPEVNYTIKYIDKSLEDKANPAMYFLPPLDNFSENVILINQAGCDYATLYATLAHEGYPGHMYQSIYFNNTNPSPIRTLMRPTGYLEGWATYCELYSYQIADNHGQPQLFALMRSEQQAILAIYAKVDLGIHYYGWTLENVRTFLSQYGFGDESAASSIYEYIVAEPASYPKYSVGGFAFMEWKNKASAALGSQFDIVAFHKFLLELGPVPFDLVDEQLTKWIDSQR